MDLREIRNYKLETMFMATFICDRYLYFASSGNSLFEYIDINTLAATCLFIAAKFEQVRKPDVSNMSYAMADLRNVKIDASEIIDMEYEILSQFQFDLTFPEPLLYLDRYMQLLELEN